jgi:hypothetical protein
VIFALGAGFGNEPCCPLKQGPTTSEIGLQTDRDGSDILRLAVATFISPELSSVKPR